MKSGIIIQKDEGMTPLKYFLFIPFFTFVACAQTEPSFLDQMESLRRPIINLAPYLYDKSAFSAAENQAIINTELTALKMNASKLQGHPTISDRAMPFTLKELQDQLAEVHTHFIRGSHDVARWQLSSSLGLCLHCHAQAPGRYTLSLSDEDLKMLPPDALNRADLLFVLRDFTRARDVYQEILSQTHSFDSELNRLYKSFNRLLFLAVRIDQNYETVLALIRDGQNNQRYPASFKAQVRALQEFIDQQVFYRPVIAHLNDQDLMTFLNDYIPQGRAFSTETDLYSAQELLELWLAGELYERLKKDKPAELRAKIFHTLALIDERSGENIFYSLSNRYLEECVDVAPASSFAFACYEDLRDRMLLAFSGSRGTDIPRDVQKQLERLKKKATPN
jgi:hypothetical protein